MLLCLVSFFQSMTRDHKSSPVLRSMKFYDGEASWTHVQDCDSNPAPGMSSSPIFADCWALTSSHVHIASFCSKSWPCCGLSRLWNLTAERGWDLGQSERESQSPRPSLLRTGEKHQLGQNVQSDLPKRPSDQPNICATKSGAKDIKWGCVVHRLSQSLPQGWATQDQVLLAVITGVEERLNAEIWL